MIWYWHDCRAGVQEASSLSFTEEANKREMSTYSLSRFKPSTLQSNIMTIIIQQNKEELPIITHITQAVVQWVQMCHLCFQVLYVMLWYSGSFCRLFTKKAVITTHALTVGHYTTDINCGKIITASFQTKGCSLCCQNLYIYLKKEKERTVIWGQRHTLRHCHYSIMLANYFKWDDTTVREHPSRHRVGPLQPPDRLMYSNPTKSYQSLSNLSGRHPSREAAYFPQQHHLL